MAASGLAILCAVSECLLTLLVLKHRRTLLANAFGDDAGVNAVFAAPSTTLSLSSVFTPASFSHPPCVSSSIVHSESVSFLPQPNSMMSIVKPHDVSLLPSFMNRQDATLSFLPYQVPDQFGQQPLYLHNASSSSASLLPSGVMKALAVLVQQAARAPHIKRRIVNEK
ncbi:Hypothetical protein, putative [Bodo saltans]|uniref:Membrane-associated protein n=1 Tax=Bodo saltans TaxID=75058 RepID=A0A0S4ISB8_BODSA|nr:Hypothetical protein, putative [Bodo saltans]|eukprot:CUF22971.1 Hypothetical protein, putative [Bodo saltans]